MTNDTTTASITQFSAFAGLVSGWGFNHWIAILCLLVSVLGLFTNVWFKWQHLKIAKAQQEAV